MRRLLAVAAVGTAVVMAIPGSAIAHRHSAHHHRTHSRVRTERFGTVLPGPQDVTAPTGSTGSTGTTGSTGATGATQPQITVASFTGGVLTLTLGDGSTVKGAVTDATEIACVAPQQQQQGGDDNQGEDDGGQGSGHEDGMVARDGFQGGGDQNTLTPCDAGSLVPGAVVLGAELALSGSQTTWEKLILAG